MAPFLALHFSLFKPIVENIDADDSAHMYFFVGHLDAERLSLMLK
ncbi:hypothetical protein [Acinetobacter sp. AND/436]